MKRYLLFIFCIANFASYAQLTEEWIKSFSYLMPTSEQSYISLRKDGSGSLYITNTNKFEYVYSSSFFCFIKLNSTGQVQWSKSGSATITGICFDKNDNIYLSGIFEDSVTILGSHLISKGEKDIYLAKLAPNGNLIWIKTFGGKGSDESGGMVISKQGKLILVGSVRENSDFTDTLIISDSRCKPFIGSFDLNGNLDYIKLWYSDLYNTSDTNYSNVKFAEPKMDAQGNIYAILKLCYIQINTEIGSIYGVPQQDDYTYYLVKIDTLAKIKKSSGLGIEMQHDSWGLKLDNYDNPYVLRSSWSQYTGTWVTILGFDSLLKYTRSLDPPLITDLSGCNMSSKGLASMGFDKDNNIFTCSHDECFDYSTVPEGDDRNYVIQCMDTSGNQFSNKKYKLGNAVVWAYDILMDDSSSFYTVGYTKTGFGFDTDSIIPYSIFVAKYNYSATGVLNINHLESIIVYPNPSSGIFTINLPNSKDAKIYVYDVLGNCVANRRCDSEAIIDLSKQPKGIYFVEIISGLKRNIRKIIIE